MTVQIALLRGVMPTGRTRVPMAELRGMLEGLGFTDVRTLLATGNAVFRSPGPAGAELETLLEGAIEKHIGPRLAVLTRNAGEFDRIVAANPFPEDSAAIPSRVTATLLRRRPAADASKEFEAAVKPPEKVSIVGDVLWLVHPDGISKSEIPVAAWRRAFKDIPHTARNWNTMLKIQAAARAIA
jgi:uncharacterized protein (DUF1697 family)